MTTQQRDADRSAASIASKSKGASCCALLGVGHGVSATQASDLDVLGLVL